MDGSRYFWYHHSDGDTLDKLDPGELARCVAAMAVMAYVVADLPEGSAAGDDELRAGGAGGEDGEDGVEPLPGKPVIPSADAVIPSGARDLLGPSSIRSGQDPSLRSG